MMMDDEERAQTISDEIESLRSIFGEDVTDAVVPTGSSNVLRRTVAVNFPNFYQQFRVLFTLPEDYPDCLPSVRIDGAYCDKRPGIGTKIALELRNVVLEDMEGSPVLLMAVQWLHDDMVARMEQAMMQKEKEVADAAAAAAATFVADASEVRRRRGDHPVPEIITGEPVKDRKSVFLPHIARVSSIEDVDAVVDELRSRRHICDATHPTMYCYRFIDARGYLNEDREDDGEAGAGDRMLHLMQRGDVLGWVVVVTRWFGGILLGPDRFRHIANVSKEIMQQVGAMK
eukprot:PhM_4_TR5369/c0_g1_i1/m.29140